MTLYFVAMSKLLMDFNSHARVGRDSKAVPEVVGSPDFNSHARVGRDNDLAIACRPLMDFNSHARVGRDTRIF